MSEMNEQQREEKRKYDREAKQRSRAKEKAERMRCMVPDLRQYRVPEDQQRKLTEHAALVVKRIQADLGAVLAEQDQYVITGVADVVLGLENQFMQEVQNPAGILVSGHFPDAIGSEAVEYIHRSPSLLKSATFRELYARFLQAVFGWSKKNERFTTLRFIQDVRAEIAGTYVLPTPEFPNPEPKKIEEAPFPSDAEILEQGRIKLSNQLESQFRIQDPNASPDARRYLDGTL